MNQLRNYNKNASFALVKHHTFLVVLQTSSKHERIHDVMNWQQLYPQQEPNARIQIQR